VTAFVMYFVGCTSMYLMAAISFERYLAKCLLNVF